MPEHWSKFLLAQPETGMQYQIVAVTLRNGRVVEDVAIVNILSLLKCKAMQTFLLTGPRLQTLRSHIENGILGNPHPGGFDEA